MLLRCDRCRRHIEAELHRCPFCAVSSGDVVRRGAAIAAALLALGGCAAEPETDGTARADPEAPEIVQAPQPPLTPNPPEPPGPATPPARAVEEAIESERSAATEIAHAEARKRRPAIVTPLQPYGIAPMPAYGIPPAPPGALYGLPPGF